MRRKIGGGRTITPAMPTRPPKRHIEIAGLPWDEDEDVTECDSATANLLTALTRRLTLNGVVHAETCLAAIGAIAGLAAQRAVFQQLAEQNDPAALKQIRSARTRTGVEYFSGEPLSRMLVPSPGTKGPEGMEGGIWSLVTAGALRTGMPARMLPDLGEMFSHVAHILAHGEEGRPSVADHQPHMTGRETLQIVWPVAMDCFLGRAPDLFPHKPTAMRRWPAIAACVAGELIEKTAGILHPRIGLIIVMESAIYASKIRPASVYAAAQAPRPTLVERLENLSSSLEGKPAESQTIDARDIAPRHAAAHDRGRAGAIETERAPRGFAATPPGDAHVHMDEEARAHRRAQGPRAHIM